MGKTNFFPKLANMICATTGISDICNRWYQLIGKIKECARSSSLRRRW